MDIDEYWKIWKNNFKFKLIKSNNPLFGKRNTRNGDRENGWSPE